MELEKLLNSDLVHGLAHVSRGMISTVWKILEMWVNHLCSSLIFTWNLLLNVFQGLSDGLHAVVFTDNHDNQRGHGNGGDVLTYKVNNKKI